MPLLVGGLALSSVRLLSTPVVQQATRVMGSERAASCWSPPGASPSVTIPRSPNAHSARSALQRPREHLSHALLSSPITHGVSVG
jgi:hypothetical protein